MAKKILANHVSLPDQDGNEAAHIEQRCPPGCNGGGRCHGKHAADVACCILTGSDGRAIPCANPDHLHRFAPSVAGWVKVVLIVLGQAARNNLTLEDGIKATDVLRACNRADRDGRGSITLQDADWEWLRKVLYDEGECKRLLGGSGQGQTAPGDIKGPFALKVLQPVLAINLKRAIDGEKLLTDSDDSDGEDG